MCRTAHDALFFFVVKRYTARKTFFQFNTKFDVHIPMGKTRMIIA